MHQRYEVERVLSLVGEGWNDCQIARATGINRTSVREWRHLGPPGTRHRRISECPRCDPAPVDEPAYAYLLGLYLGDGYISRDPRTYRLRIVQDARYPELIRLAEHTIARVRGGKRTAGTVQRTGCVEIYSYWQHWPCLFPQHGSGRKHHREIVLEVWQARIVDTYPRQLIRGLIHSDGCRVVNRIKSGKYAYTRYFFSNNSKDILQVFRDACDRIEIGHRDSRPNCISVARRADVAALDGFIGPKA